MPILQDLRSSDDTMETSLSEPEPSHAAAPSLSDTVAESPILRGEHPHTRSILCSSQISCSPRSEAMKEWTSSMTTNLRPENMRGTSSAWLSRMPSRDSGVI